MSNEHGGFPGEKTILDEISNVSMKKPHVVLLGAGASRSAFPDGEGTGRQLPLMNNFMDIVPVKDILRDTGISTEGVNFEDLYGQLCVAQGMESVRQQLESSVFEYFASLELLNTPTIYDYLVLGLRSKDIIATFNWDPFLIQAVRRHKAVTKPPHLLFLHGNVLQGYCSRDRQQGIRGARCSKCGEIYADVPLLYPIGDKNYDANPAISASWTYLKEAFSHAFWVTIFGYGAPKSDKGAIGLLQASWGDLREKQFEQFEFIDIQDEELLATNWQDFIFESHFEVHRNFRDSWIAQHPRRTGEAYISQFIDANFVANNPVPDSSTVDDLIEWFMPLINAEADSD